jgi:hypothetical protein
VLAEGAAVLQDSSQTREEMMRVLRGYPPEVSMVLKLDPTLLGNKDYMANYPALATWVTAHPDVAHNPHTSLALYVMKQRSYRAQPTSLAEVFALGG